MVDEATKSVLEYGRSLVDLLKQPLYNPMPLHKQVILLCAASNRLMVGVDGKDMEAFKNGVVAREATKYIQAKKLLI